MNKFDLEAGERLKFIREIFNEGSKLSARQFAYILGESRDKIANYETGRSSIPIDLLKKLHDRGYNVVFIITGEGSLFASNKKGEVLKSKLITRFEFGELSDERLIKHLDIKKTIKKVAAGKIN